MNWLILVLALLLGTGCASRITDRMDTMNYNLAKMSSQLDETNARLATMSGQLDETNARLTILEKSMKKLSGEPNALPSSEAHP
jgi:hypothetical protein